MKSLFAAAVALACTTSAQAADTWTCAYVFPTQPIVMKFTIAAPNLTVTIAPPPNIVVATSPQNFADIKSGDVYTILQDNDYGLVAARGIAEIKPKETLETVSATMIVIRKQTGQFRYATQTLGTGELAAIQNSMRGTCVKD